MIRLKNLPVILALGWSLLSSGAALGASFDGQPKVLLHLDYPTTKGFACERGQLADCQQAVVNGYLYPSGRSYFIYLLVARGGMPSVAGLQLSVDYSPASQQGVDVLGWNYCADAHFEAPGPNGAWPAPGSSNLLTWDRFARCQTGETAVAGYFYVAAYSPDVFKVVPRRVDGKSAVGDCEAREYVLLARDLGRVAFSADASTPGCNPCVEDCTTQSPRGKPISVPIELTTWSGIKVLMGR